MDLAEKIREMQWELIALAEKKQCGLSDPEVYRQSCLIDEMIVELMKAGNYSMFVLDRCNPQS